MSKNKNWKYFKVTCDDLHDIHILGRYTKIKEGYYKNLECYIPEDNKWAVWSKDITSNKVLITDVKINKLEVFKLISSNKVY